MHLTPRRSLGSLAARALVLASLALLASLLFSSSAFAAGKVSLAKNKVQEVDGKWKLQMTIDYGSEPHIAHIPMLFVFTPKVLYERALTDKSPEKPVINKIPLENQASINESMDVGFGDPSGKIYKITKFDFIVRRDHEFEAGEYELVVKRQGDGVQVGKKQKIVLEGDNPVVDRRAMVFSGEKKSEDKTAKADAPPGPAGSEELPMDEPEGDPSAGESMFDAPPEVPPKQGGCGCRVGAREGGERGFAFAALLALAGLALARRRG